MKILLTDGNNQNTLGAVRHLANLGHVVDVISDTKISLCSLSKYTHYNHVLRHNQFNTDLIGIIKSAKIDLLIPVGYNSVLMCAKMRDTLGLMVKIILPDDKSLKIASDKAKTMEFAKKIGVIVPKTIVANNFGQIKNAIKEIGYPVVIKPTLEGYKPIYIYNQVEVDSKINKIFLKKESVLVQEYIKGEGFGYFALVDKGKVLIEFMHRRIREYPVSGGASTLAESIFDSKLQKLGKKILKELCWNGLVMVEFKKNVETGEFVLMEINPKLWGSLDLSLASGVDFLTGYIFLSENKEIINKTDYKNLLRFQWPFPNDFSHCLKKPRDFHLFWKDLLNKNVKNNIKFDDLGPLIWQIGIIFTRMFK